MRFFHAFCIAVLAAMPASVANADNWVLGIGSADFEHVRPPTVTTATVEWQGKPLWSGSNWHVGPVVAAMTDERQSAWIGAGLAAKATFGSWFVEFSEAPGLFKEGEPSTDLGGPLEFRSLIGLGYQITDTTSASLAIDHRSSGNITWPNPGVNNVSLRVSVQR